MRVHNGTLLVGSRNCDIEMKPRRALIWNMIFMNYENILYVKQRLMKSHLTLKRCIPQFAIYGIVKITWYNIVAYNSMSAECNKKRLITLFTAPRAFEQPSEKVNYIIYSTASFLAAKLKSIDCIDTVYRN